jgi:hypothetical protein
LEELDFLHEVCLAALYSSRFVKFAAVVDNNGRLIIAEYRKRVQYYWRTDFTSDDNYRRHDSSYLFHMDYLIPAIRKRSLCYANSMKKKERHQEGFHFEIIEIDDDVRIAVAPLNVRKGKYLCLYIESSAPNQEIMSKLRKVTII